MPSPRPDPTWAGGFWIASRANQLRAQGVFAFGISLDEMFHESIGEASGRISRQLLMLLDVFERGFAPSERARANLEIAQAAQQAVLRSYAQTVTRNRKGGHSPYRLTAKKPTNRRYAGGALKRALAAPDFYDTGPDHIRIINVRRLDIEARHWARLNAGTRGIGTGSMRTFTIRFGNLVVGAMGLGMEARPAFYVPRGYWWSGDGPMGPSSSRTGQDQFFPTSEGPAAGRQRRGYLLGQGPEGQGARVPVQRRRLSRGIRARNFLDAGVARMAREIGPTYQRLLSDAWKGSIAGTRTSLTVVARPQGAHWRVSTHRRPTTTYPGRR